MSNKFQNKYRIDSARWKHWDYGWNAAYFITICTGHRICFFGEVVNGQMVLNEMGKMADDCWRQIPGHFPFVKLGEHIVMPNHVHGILIIEKITGAQNAGDNVVPNDGQNGGRHGERTGERNVETRLIASLPSHPQTPSHPPNTSIPPNANEPLKQPGGITGDKNPMLHDNLGKIARWFKGRTTFEIRKIHADFAWQSRFHDHVIRDQESFQKISEYIIANPMKWASDQFFKTTRC